ncbi:hypothetical protein F8M41_008273 [Gigaspora margarita]|uniref:Uncharacterized protein n=1 Tax=Gigaspora margarita TaxID=4874 RepID=A0A8H3X4H7_GIGMA|nr:hypothetical protein F8M41_008273 [Gigaspora margarita]
MSETYMQQEGDAYMQQASKTYMQQASETYMQQVGSEANMQQMGSEIYQHLFQPYDESLYQQFMNDEIYENNITIIF